MFITRKPLFSAIYYSIAGSKMTWRVAVAGFLLSPSLPHLDLHCLDRRGAKQLVPASSVLELPGQGSGSGVGAEAQPNPWNN